jgi:hypothetical protein
MYLFLESCMRLEKDKPASAAVRERPLRVASEA